MSAAWHSGTRRLAASLAVVALLFAGRAWATEYYVSTLGSDDNGGQSMGAAFLTVEKAVAMATGEGDTITISNGTYATAAEIVLSRNLAIRGATGKPEDVIIRATGTYRVFTLDCSTARISGVTIRDGNAGSGSGGGVYITANGGTLENSVVHSCKNTGWGVPGGGVYVAKDSALGLVDCCVISNCACGNRQGNGGGVALALYGGEARSCLVVENSHTDNSGNGQVACGTVKVAGGRLVNCTVAKNHSYTCPGVWATGGFVINCIIAENGSESSADAKYLAKVGEDSLFSNCLATVALNDSCFAMKHPFHDVDNGDYAPILGSVGVDHGLSETWMATAKDILGNVRVSGAKPDIGAIEYDQSSFSADFSASPDSGKAPLDVTFTVATAGGTGPYVCRWDWNGDGTVDDTSAGSTNHVFTEAALNKVRLTVEDRGAGKSFAVPLPVTVKVFGDAIRVVKGNANAAEPYDTWENAAATVQTAYDFAEDGMTVVISNGTHEISSQMQILKSVTIRGFTGKPEDAILKAKGTHRMFLLSNADAKISGVTIRDGNSGALSGGGVYIDVGGGTVENSIIHSCQATGWGMPGGGIYIASGADLALVDCCVISNCMCHREGNGGGTAMALYGGTARSCLVTENCETSKNGSQNNAGSVKVVGGTLINCTVTGNKSYTCPGVWATSGRVVNCIIAGNTKFSASDKKENSWAGEESCFVNCIGTDAMNDTCYEMADPFVNSAKKDYTVALGTKPVDFGVKEDWMTSAHDLAGNARLSGKKPDAGAYEADQSQFAAGFSADVSSGIEPLTVTFTATVYGEEGEVTYYWDWDGDGVADETNKTNVTEHEFETATTANVKLTVKNGDAAGTVYSVPNAVKISALSKYVYVSDKSANPTSPFSTWGTAAHTLEDALAAAIDGCEVIVSNGTYEIASEVQVTKGVFVRGLTGRPEDVILKAKGTHRMFWLAHEDAKFSDMTIRDGYISGGKGGGVYIDTPGGTLYNCVVHSCQSYGQGCPGGGVFVAEGENGLVDGCVISNCLSYREGSYGGGTALGLWGGVVRNCLITENVEPSKSGTQNTAGSVVVNGGKLINCTITKNTSYTCAGIWAVSGEIVNCIVAENTCILSTDLSYTTWAGEASCFSKCVAPVAINENCFVLEHPFADSAHKNYTPLIGTASIDGGILEEWMEEEDAKDVLGQARISGEKPDIGAIEYQQNGLVVGYTVDKTLGKAPLAVQLTATVLGKKGTLTYKWDLDGDGTFETETAQPTLNHTFDDPVSVAIGLKVVDDGATPAAEAEAEVKTTVRALGRAIFVSERSANPAEPYDRWDNAAKDVAAAFALACDGSEVVISNGTYDISNQLQIVTGVTIRGLTGDARDVVLRSVKKTTTDQHRIFWLNNPNARLLDLTLRDAVAADNGAGAFVDVHGGTIRRCRFIGCASTGAHAKCGGGAYIAASATDAEIESCVFTGCTTHNAGSGAAIYVASGLAYNCIVTNNSGGNAYYPVSVTGTGTFANSIVLGNLNCPKCSGVYATGGEVVNCIIAGSTTQSTTENACWSKGNATGAYFANCVMDIADLPDSGCMTEAPAETFKNCAKGNYRLKQTSKALDGGVYRDWMATAKDFRGRPRKLGPAPDCGAFECNSGLMLLVQ